MLTLVLIISSAVLVIAIFAAAETALTAVSESHIHKLVAEGNRRAKLVNHIRENAHSFISTVLITLNLLSIVSSSIATIVAIDEFGMEGVKYVTAVMGFVIIVFAEVIPKTYAIMNPEKVALFLGPLLYVIVKILMPINTAIHWFVDVVFRMFGVNIAEKDEFLSAIDELRGTIDLRHKEGRVKKTDRDMLDGVLNLEDTAVDEIMIHRKNVYSVNIDLPTQDLISAVLQAGHTRTPIWQDDPENIIGILHIKDLLKAINLSNGDYSKINIKGILAKPWFIPETTTLKKQLTEFREKKNHCAIVIDEYGAVQGLVTINDILEEIVGTIDDEQTKSSDIKPHKDGSYTIKGYVTVRDVNRLFEWEIPDEDANTIAGLIIHHAKRIPVQGEVFEFYGFKFEILSVKNNQIIKIKLTLLPQEDDEDNE